jgi:hypothetical protein
VTLRLLYFAGDIAVWLLDAWLWAVGAALVLARGARRVLWPWLPLVGLSLLALAQTGREIPPYDSPDGSHQGQPKWCANYDDYRGYKMNCKCSRDCKEHPRREDPQCKVYCRKDACRCQSDCDS